MAQKSSDVNNQDETKIHSGRIGLFGGTFNPLHVGHISCIVNMKSRLGLEKIYVIPAAQNPRKTQIEGASIEQRLEMLQIGLAEYESWVEIDAQEIKRGGLSYTIDTLSAYAKTTSPEDLYLIVGLDQFDEFDKWKDFQKILSIANLAVATRPGYEQPHSAEELPAGLQPLVAAFDRSFIALTTGRNIEFVRLPETDVSASEVRKRLRTGRGVERHLTIPVEEYVKEQKIYGPLKDRIGDYEKFTRFCADVLFEKKGINVRGFDLRSADAASEFTLIASGTSTRHTTALAENVARAVKDEFNVHPQSLEGSSEGRWVLMDYGSLIVHIFYDFVRNEYQLEELWRSAKDMQLVDPAEGRQKMMDAQRNQQVK